MAILANRNRKKWVIIVTKGTFKALNQALLGGVNQMSKGFLTQCVVVISELLDIRWATQVATAVEELMKSVVGEDPSRIQFILQKLYRQKFYSGGTCDVVLALSFFVLYIPTSMYKDPY